MCLLSNPETKLYTAKAVVLGHKRCVYKKGATYKPSMQGIRRIILNIGSHWSNPLEVTPYLPDIGSHPIYSTTLIDSSLPSNHHNHHNTKSLHNPIPILFQPARFRLEHYLRQLPTLMEAKKQSTQLNQPQQPPQQLAVSTAQPATSISTQGSSTSGVTNVYKLSKAELRRYQLTHIEEPEEHIDPDYLHYLRAIGAYDSFQQQSEQGKGRGRKSRR
ncbi:hypothetical protein YC2023_076501 [Brassica napus]